MTTKTKRAVSLRIFKIILRTLALSYLAVTALFYFQQEKFIFYPQVIKADQAFDFKTPFQEKTVLSGGMKSTVWFLKLQNL